jgi:replicative DNA helicase
MANDNFEESLIGGLLINPQIDVAARYVQPEHFRRDDLREIYRAMLALDEQRREIDIVTVAAQLNAEGKLEFVGGDAQIWRLMNACPNSMAIEHYAIAVLNDFIRRDYQRRGLEIANAARNAPIEQIPQLAESLILQAPKPSAGGLKDAAEAALELMSYIEAENVAIKTHFPKFDSIVGGLLRGSTAIITGDTSAGKTAFSLQLAEQVALSGLRVLYISTESPARILVARRVAGLAKVERSKIAAGELSEAEKDRMREQIIAYQERFSGRLAFSDEARSVPAIAAYLQNQAFDFLVVDHLGELETAAADAQSRIIGIEGNFQAIRALAMRNNLVALVIHTQTADSVMSPDAEEDELPDLARLFSWSKQLRYMADVILHLRQIPPKGMSNKMTAILSLLKNRDGERFARLKYEFDPIMQWYNEI